MAIDLLRDNADSAPNRQLPGRRTLNFRQLIATTFFLLVIVTPGIAQSWTARSFTIADGLPSNNLYNILRDTRGFLWISSERGTARFDGNHFRIYRTSDGLPDNEIVALRIDAAGVVWALPYHEAPVKYNLLRDHFEKDAASTPANIAPPQLLTLQHTRYACDTNGIYKMMLNERGTVIQTFFRPMHMEASHLSFTSRSLALISNNGTAATLIDTATLSVTAALPLGDALASDVLEDGEGHVWITTSGQGLIRLSRTAVTSYNSLLPFMQPSTIAVDGPVILCGDNRGRIVVFRRGCVEQVLSIARWSKAVSRIRSIIPLKDGYYIAVEGDASLLLDKSYNIASVYNRPLLNFTDRCAALWHDSIILAGSHERAQKLAYKACTAYEAVAIRTDAIGMDSRDRLIIGSSDGCYRKDDTGLYPFARRNPALGAQVSDICTTPDGLLWVGFAANIVAALRGDTVAGIIHLGRDIPGTGCNALRAGKDGELWLGTDAALSRVRYTTQEGRLRWQVTSFNASDGIPGAVADVAWQQDSVYAATTAGVYVLPAGLEPSVRDIPVFITGIRIAGRDTVLREAWELPYGMSDLDIRYAGIDLSGWGPVYQYRINSEEWREVGDDHLMLKQLPPGAYTIQIRALRRDGSPSSGVASLRVQLRAPFWMSAWFWVVAVLLLFTGAATALQYLLGRKRKRQLARLSAEGELAAAQQQAFFALMNPHFIFNALNSIQHYVLTQDKRAANRYLSGFGRLIRMNFESAQQSYISLEEELERLRLYLSLEAMRFGERLQYSIEVADDVAPEDWQIPAMMLQPFIENAVLHGIAPLKGEGRLDICITRRESSLQVRICDNGIGMAASHALRQKQQGHVSRSMELIRRRVAVLRKLRRQTIEIRVEAAYPDDALQPGTCVEIVFSGEGLG